MKETLDYLRWRWNGLKQGGGPAALPAVFAVGLMLGVYYASLRVPPGWVTWVLVVPASVVVVLTALSRLNAMPQDLVGWQWQLRRVGLIMTGTAAVTVLTAPFTAVPVYPAWSGVLFAWGIAAVWSTSPESRGSRPKPGPYPRSPIERIFGWFQRALRRQS